MQAMFFARSPRIQSLIGYANLLSLWHAMFFGLATPVCSHAAKVWCPGARLGFASASPASAALGYLYWGRSPFAAPHLLSRCHRRFSQMVVFVCVEAPLTHGEDGIQAVPQGKALGFICLAIRGSSTVLWAVVFLYLVSCRGLRAVQFARFAIFSRQSVKTIRARSRSAYRVLQYKLAALPVGGNTRPCRREPRRCRP